MGYFTNANNVRCYLDNTGTKLHYYNEKEEVWKLFPHWSNRTTEDGNDAVWYANKHIFPIENVTKVTIVPRTQKAKGVSFLSLLQANLAAASIASYVPPFIVAQEESHIPDTVTSCFEGKSRLFARPCPPTAVHGFIESRPVDAAGRKSVDVAKDLRAVLREVLTVEPKGELLVMPFVPATHNMVLANGMLTIGVDHDGATANRKAIVVPTADVFIPSATLIRAGVEDSPFIEAVVVDDRFGTMHSPAIVQLRNGPKLPRMLDYIPAATVVERVVTVTPATDMLKFPAVAASFKPGTVVWAKSGGISSHAGIHCTNHNIPFLTSFKPEVGMKLVPNAGEKKPANREAFTEGLTAALTCNASISGCAALGRTMLFALHSYPFFDLSEPVHARLLGAAAGIAVRLGMTACLGEHRYGRLKKAEKRIEGKESNKPSRTAVYDGALTSPFDESWKKFLFVGPSFGWPGWVPWSGSVGGPKWHICSIMVQRLWTATREFVDGKGDAAAVVDALNLVVNVSHNGGKLLTKFINDGDFNTAAGHYLPFLGLGVSPILYKFATDTVKRTVPMDEMPGPSPVDMDDLRLNLMRLLEADGMGRIKYFKEVYSGIVPAATFRDFAKSCIACHSEAVVQFKAAKKALTALGEGKIPWKNDSPCGMNCRESLWAGAVMSWNYTDKDGYYVRLEPCESCDKQNKTNYCKKWAAESKHVIIAGKIAGDYYKLQQESKVDAGLLEVAEADCA